MSDTRRLHIGGLFTGIVENDLRDRFGKFGEVEKIDIINRDDGEVKTFAYLDIKLSDSSLQKCFSLYNKSKWKGNVINVQLAKESYFQKLAREREELLQNKVCINESPKSINHIRKEVTMQNNYGKHIVFNDDQKQNDSELFDVNKPILKKKMDNSLVTGTHSYNRSSKNFENAHETISTKKVLHLKNDSPRKNIKDHLLLDNVMGNDSDSFKIAKKSYNTPYVSQHTARNNVIKKEKDNSWKDRDNRKRHINCDDGKSQMETKRQKIKLEQNCKSNEFLKPVRYDPDRLDHKIYEISKPEHNLIESKNHENNHNKNLVEVDETVALKLDRVHRKRNRNSDVQSHMETKRRKKSDENVIGNISTIYKKSNGISNPLDHERSKPEQNLIASDLKVQNNRKKNVVKVNESVALKSENLKDNDRFYVVSENLKESFTNSTKFSFTAMFDIIKDTSFSDVKEEEKIYKPSFESSISVWDEDNFNHNKSKDKKNQQILILPEQNTNVNPFFFSESEPRIKNGFDFFNKTDSSIVKENWTEQRNLLVEEYRKKKKQILRHNAKGKNKGHWNLQSKRNRQRWNKKEY